MDHGSGCYIIKIAGNYKEIKKLVLLDEIESVSVYANGKIIVFLKASIQIASSGNNGEEVIIISEKWHNNTATYSICDIKWIEYAVRGTEEDYYKNRALIKNCRQLEILSG